MLVENATRHRVSAGTARRTSTVLGVGKAERKRALQVGPRAGPIRGDAAIFATFFVALWIWFIPRWIAAARGVTLELHTNAAALALMIAGAGIMVLSSARWSASST